MPHKRQLNIITVDLSMPYDIYSAILTDSGQVLEIINDKYYIHEIMYNT